MMKTVSVPRATTRIATTHQPRTRWHTLNSNRMQSAAWWRHPWGTPTVIFLVAKLHPPRSRMDATQSDSAQLSHLGELIPIHWLKILAEDQAKCQTSPKRGDVKQCTVSEHIKVKTTYRLSLPLQVIDHRTSPIKNCPTKTHQLSVWMPSQLCHLQEASNEPALLDLKSPALPLQCSTACARATLATCIR